MGANSNHHSDVKYTQVRLENDTEGPQNAGASNGFGRTIKFVAVLVVVIILFTCSSWAFSGPSSVNTQKGIHSFSYESHREREIIFSAQGQQEELKDDSTTDVKEETAESAPSDDKVQSNSVIPQGDSTQNIHAARGKSPDVVPGNSDTSIKGRSSNQKEAEIQTLFSTLHSTFNDLKLGEDNKIPTVEFIKTSSDLKPFLDRIGSSISMIEGDLNGNAEDPAHSQTLQDMLLNDIKMGKEDDDSRSVVALLWLKRAFQFLERFLKYISDGQQPVPAAQTAYEEVLGRYHSWFIRGAFKVAMHLLPSRPDFLKKMAINEQDLLKPNYEAKVVADMKLYLHGMSHILGILEDFYQEHHLEN